MSKRKRGGAQPGAGRPPLPPGESLSSALLVRMTPEQRATIRDAADAAGVSSADLMRDATLDAIARGTA